MVTMNTFKRFGMIIATIILIGCAPMSKDAYMRQFSDFTMDVSQNCKSYNDKDWEKMTEKYNSFSGEWYEKFKNKLSTKEKVLVKSYQARWYYSRTMSVLNDVVEIEKLIRFYMENNMESDLQKLCEEAHNIGGETEKTVNEIMKKLDVSIK